MTSHRALPASPALRAFVLLLAITLLLAAAPGAPGSASGDPPDLDVYAGAGTWIDMYDPHRVWDDPERTVARLDARGVRTLYIETANYHKPARASVFRRDRLERFVEAAHDRGIAVVAWYLPGLADLERDRDRMYAALDLRTPRGDTFDSVALDIESNLVAALPARNRRLLALARELRFAAPEDLPLGAIVPDQRSSSFSPALWPNFPYAAIRPYFDVVVPMSYSTNRVSSPGAVYAYTLANIRFLRRRSGDPDLPVHVIGGIARGLGPRSSAAVVRAAQDGDAIGASFYKFSLSDRGEWRALEAFDDF